MIAGKVTPFAMVLDDDPTGSQCVADIPIVTEWSDDSLRWLMSQGTSMGFVMTNSRALPAVRAAAVCEQIVDRALPIATELGLELVFLSRSDSTLRGHFAAELDAICRALGRHGQPAEAIVFAPAFFEAGRTTEDDIHYVQTADGRTPVAETPYAADATFGFTESWLPAWIQGRGGGVPWPVSTLSLAELRRPDSDRVTLVPDNPGHLAAPHRPPIVVVNGVTQADYDAAAEAARSAVRAGSRIVIRCGPSFVASWLGLPPPTPVREIPVAVTDGTDSGLIVVGSHVPTTSKQLAYARQSLALPTVTLEVEQLLEADAAQHIARVASTLIELLGSGDVVLCTTRSAIVDADPQVSLEIAAGIAGAVVATVKLVLAATDPAWLIVKGGITSATVIRDAMGFTRGWITGQVFQSLLPIWRQADETGIPTIIFPGNVGTESTLADVVGRLRLAIHEGPHAG